MKLYIVYDTKGDGRVVGVWDAKRPANRIIKRFPAYYKLHEMELNKLNPEVLHWADNKEQKQFLETELVKQDT